MATLVVAAPATAAGFDHAPLDALLAAHVKDGRVDYAALKRGKSRKKLDAYVAALGKANLVGMDRAQRLAFYLNAYNALVLGAVVERYPLASVMDVKGFFDAHRHRVAGRSMTLNHLENKVIRPRFKDPRVHFALVCAAVSCPPIQPAAYSAGTLDATLTRLTRRFIRGRDGVRVSGSKVAVSKLFQWYREDFVEAAGSLGKYLARYHDRHAERLAAPGTKIEFFEYSWKLNERKNGR